MLKYLKKLPKKIKIIGTVILTVVFLCFLLISNLERGVSVIANKFFNLNLKIENIDLSFGGVKVNKLEIYDKKERLMIDIPEIKLDHSLTKLKEITINSPSVYIINDEDGINIKEAFKTEKSTKTKEEDEEEFVDTKETEEEVYKPKSILIDKINLNNFLLSYKYEKNGKVLEKTLKNINASVESGKDKGIYAKVSSDENIEKFDVIYSNKDEPLYLDLKLSGIDLENYQELIKAEIPKIKKIYGKLEADAIISQKDRAGFIRLDGIELYHSEVESDIKADLEVKLDGEDIDLILDYEIFGEKDQIESMYKDRKLYSLIQIKNIDEKKLSKIVPLREKNIDLSKIDIEDVILLTQYNITDGLKINFDLKPNKVEIGAISLDKMKANLTIKDGVKYVENSHIYLKIADMPTKLNVEAIFKDNVADILFQIQNLDETSNLIPDFNGILKLENGKEKLNANLKSNIISFNTDYDKIEKILNLYSEDFEIKYDKKDKSLTGSGELDFLLYGLKSNIKYFIDEEKINFEKIVIENEKDSNKKLEAEGYYNLINRNFVLNYNATKLAISRLYKGQEINLSFDGEGKFEKYQNIISGIGNVTGLNLSYLLGDMSSITGKYSLKINEENELELEFNGNIEELTYGEYKFKDVLLKLGFERDTLNIKQIGNEFVSLTGKIDRKTRESDLKLVVKNFTNKEIGFDKLDFNVKNAEIDVTGNLDNPDIAMVIREAQAFLNGKVAKITGNLKMKDKKIDLSSLNLNGNKLTGKYDLETKKYNAKLIINDNVSNYLSGNDLDFKLNGVLNLNGKDGNINSSLKLQGNGKTKDIKLPNLDLKANYTAKNYSDGVINLETLSLSNSLGKNLLNFNGDINIKHKKLNILLNDTLDLIDLKEYTKQEDLKGKIKLNAKINGNLDNPQYALIAESDEILFKGQKITEINSKLKGDKSSLNVDTLNFKYLENLILGQGSYNINKKEYNFNLKTGELINLSFFNKMFADKLKANKIKNIVGTASFDISINKNGLNGAMEIGNAGLEIEKEDINIRNFNSRIKIKNNKLEIEDFIGKINNGLLKINGYVNIPKDFKNLPDSLDYLIDLEAENVDYNRADVAKLLLNSKIRIKNKQLIGEIIIDDAIVYDIPNDYKSISSIVSKKILKKKDKTVKEKAEEEKKKAESKKAFKEFLKKWEYADLKLKTKKPVILEIEDFNIAVGEVKGKLDIDLAVTGTNGRFYITGNSEILNGSIYVNTNKFILERALVSFNDITTFLPDVNPDIFVDTRVNMEEENIRFSVNGRIKNLIYTIRSENGNATGEFNSLLIDSDKHTDFQGNINEVYAKFMRNIIAGQLAEIIFGSITKTTKKVLGLTRLMVKPEVSAYSIDSKVEGVNNTGRTSEIYDIGAKIEAEKNIYKDKIYLYGNAKLFGSNKEAKIKSSLEKHGVKEYDVGVKYRMNNDNIIIGVGVGTVSDRYIYKDENKHKRNYHIDLKFRKKFDSFSEIFTF